MYVGKGLGEAGLLPEGHAEIQCISDLDIKSTTLVVMKYLCSPQISYADFFSVLYPALLFH
jgi:hypothetical protein